MASATCQVTGASLPTAATRCTSAYSLLLIGSPGSSDSHCSMQVLVVATDVCQPAATSVHKSVLVLAPGFSLSLCLQLPACRCCWWPPTCASRPRLLCTKLICLCTWILTLPKPTTACVQVLMVATDVYRPAAIDQLVSLGQRVNVPVFEMGTDAQPADIAAAGLAKAKAEGYDAIIVDTAGRTQAWPHATRPRLDRQLCTPMWLTDTLTWPCLPQPSAYQHMNLKYNDSWV